VNLKRLYQRLRDPRRAEADLDEEVRSFYDTMKARRVDQGLAPDEAHRITHADYGPPARVIEQVRDSRLEAVFATVMHDLRYAIRQLRKNPGFGAVAVLSLGLGIGANTAIYSFMESILLRSLPVADPESLVVLNWHSRPPQNANKEWVHVVHGVQGILWPGDKGSLVSGMFPYGAFETLREENPVFSTLFGYFNGLTRNLAVNGQATIASTEYVTGEYFRGLGSVAGRGTSDRLRRRPSRRSAGRRNQFCDKPAALWGTVECDWTTGPRRQRALYGNRRCAAGILRSRPCGGARPLPSVAHESPCGRCRSGSYV
jgi:macrolide transport system ATP-binding/permease protein